MPKAYKEKTILQALRETPDPKAVAERLDAHPSTVYRAIKRSGIDLDLIKQMNGMPSYRKRLTIQYLVQKGISQTELARRLGVTPQYINQLAA